MRGHNIWFTCIHQELNQIDIHLRNTLLSLGTYIFGGTSSMESARLLADALFFRNPFELKDIHNVWASEQIGRFITRHFIIDKHAVFMPLEEQSELFAQRIKKLGMGEFLLRPALSEGSIGTAAYPLSIRHIDRHPITGELAFPDQEQMARLRSQLVPRSGRPLELLLAKQTATSGQETLQEPPFIGALPAPEGTDASINRRELLD